MRPAAMAPSVGPRMSMYPPGAPGLGQQLFYGQGPPALIPPQVIAIFLSVNTTFFQFQFYVYFCVAEFFCFQVLCVLHDLSLAIGMVNFCVWYIG